MDKLILVFYVGLKGVNNSSFQKTVEEVKKQKNQLVEKEDIITMILPDHDLTGNSIKVDCINPKYINKSVYDLILEKVKKIEKEILVDKFF